MDSKIMIPAEPRSWLLTVTSSLHNNSVERVFFYPARMRRRAIAYGAIHLEYKVGGASCTASDRSEAAGWDRDKGKRFIPRQTIYIARWRCLLVRGIVTSWWLEWSVWTSSTAVISTYIDNIDSVIAVIADPTFVLLCLFHWFCHGAIQQYNSGLFGRQNIVINSAGILWRMRLIMPETSAGRLVAMPPTPARCSPCWEGSVNSLEHSAKEWWQSELEYS